jgi:hypothetical protein
MSRLTFPQSGDRPESAFFAALAGRGRSGIIAGLGFSVDFSVPEVTVSSGTAVIERGAVDTADPSISPVETITDASVIVQIDAQTASLTAGTLNHIFLEARPDVDDSGTVVPDTNSARPPASLKIGEIDTSSNTVSEGWNRISDSGVLTFPDEQAADDQSSFLDEGAILYARDSDIHFFVS